MKPRHARALSQIEDLLQRGQVIAAIDPLERLIADCPEEPTPHLYFAQALRALGRTAKAIGHLDAATQRFPDIAEFRHEWAINFLIAGHAQNAAVQFSILAALVPGHDAPWAGLGESLIAEKCFGTAARAFLHAHHMAPANWQYSNNAAATLVALGDYNRASIMAQLALDRAPHQVDCLLTFGNALAGLGQLNQAIPYFAKAVQSQPKHLKARIDLIDAQIRTLRFSEAYGQIQSFGPAALPPEILIKRAELFDRMGLAHESLADYRVVLRPPVDGERPVALMNYLAVLSKADEQTALSVKAEMNRMLAGAPIDTDTGSIAARNGQKIRLGYVSADFRDHPVGRNFGPLLFQRDHQAFDVTLYSDVIVPDSQTELFAQASDRIRQTAHLSDSDLARLIRSDQIDILVILAARFDNNRLLLARRRSAPIQISFHDIATSGLENMDYLIADPVLVPKGSREAFVEKIIRLPSFYTHEPLLQAPDPGPLPLIRNGFLTLGSFSNPSKITSQVLELWAHVLTALPDARLKLKYLTHYADPLLRQRIMASFGPLADRIDFANAPAAAQNDHLMLYRDVDITLDTFPFCGSTTTFESLSMGVPVVSLALAPMVSRWSSSLLTKLGLDSYIANSPDDFVAIIKGLAKRPDELRVLRGQLPGRIAASPLCRTRDRTRQMERVFRALFQRHLVHRKGGS
jgi:predicted O-linked N-acetylglucosamine transferase (SPINDLY family)